MFIKNTTGIVLCGGKSSRMGTNKGALKLGNQTLVEIAISTIKPFCKDILISSNSDDFKFLPYPFINDVYTDIGPISGIYSTLLHSSTEHNLIINCDTPFLDQKLFDYIIQNSKDYDIVLPSHNGFIQSLTGYFNKSVLKFISDEINLEHYKPIQIFKSLNLNQLEINKSLSFYHNYMFLNINTMEDYQEAVRIYQNISS